MLTVESTIIMFAFRYALGRATAAPSIAIRCLEENWHRLSEQDKEQIVREIMGAVMRGDAGSDAHANEWLKFADEHRDAMEKK